ncbi:MAG TPA: hypothetical protein VKN14_03640 [Flavobacteriaceae bacterium]|nr:hypothetical protein [Flavobacteriaceae bacterium]
MKNSLFLLILILLIISCSAIKNRTANYCSDASENGFNNVVIEKTVSIIEKDTFYINEAKFECTSSAFNTKKMMYDNYGSCTKEVVNPNDVTLSIRIWEDVKLFADVEKLFIVAAKGNEELNYIYSSVMVFDNKGNDMLSENSKYRDTLIGFFGSLLKNNNLGKRDFYEKYWAMADPDMWKYIQEHPPKKQ